MFCRGDLGQKKSFFSSHFKNIIRLLRAQLLGVVLLKYGRSPCYYFWGGSGGVGSGTPINRPNVRNTFSYGDLGQNSSPPPPTPTPFSLVLVTEGETKSSSWGRNVEPSLMTFCPIILNYFVLFMTDKFEKER